MYLQVIEKVIAREILDSRGNPTVEVEVYTKNGFGRASIPSGASTGTHEALELRDENERYLGRGVRKAVANINTIIKRNILGMNVFKQREIDKLLIELDGTSNKSKLGANAILGVSIAVAKAAASAAGLPLYQYLGGAASYTIPVPSLNVINGGKHAGNKLAIQEFMIQPVEAGLFAEAIRMAVETYHMLKNLIKEKYGIASTNVGDEGGYAPAMTTTREALEAISLAIEKAGYEGKIKLGLDSAASEFFKNGEYAIDGKKLSGGELIDYYIDIAKTYPILLFEDPFHEEAFHEFAELTRKLRGTIIVGDDIFVTNVARLKKGIELNAGNALLLKLNQIGTISEAFDAARLAFRSSWKVMVSHRSGETEDTTIADVAVALGAELIKAGAPARSERNAKYNQLLRIEEQLGASAQYLGLTLKP
ncbi:MAG: phosphopyruvate hydratase [Halobacteria archaeon]